MEKPFKTILQEFLGEGFVVIAADEYIVKIKNKGGQELVILSSINGELEIHNG